MTIPGAGVEVAEVKNVLDENQFRDIKNANAISHSF
jgi:hypothetical protein